MWRTLILLYHLSITQSNKKLSQGLTSHTFSMVVWLYILISWAFVNVKSASSKSAIYIYPIPDLSITESN